MPSTKPRPITRVLRAAIDSARPTDGGHPLCTGAGSRPAHRRRLATAEARSRGHQGFPALRVGSHRGVATSRRAPTCQPVDVAPGEVQDRAVRSVELRRETSGTRRTHCRQRARVECRPRRARRRGSPGGRGSHGTDLAVRRRRRRRWPRDLRPGSRSPTSRNAPRCGWRPTPSRDDDVFHFILERAPSVRRAGGSDAARPPLIASCTCSARSRSATARLSI